MEDKKITMPAVALRGLTILPGMVQHFDISREKSVRAVETAMMGDQKVYLVTQRNPQQEVPTAADLYQMGTVSQIKQIVKMPNGILRVMVEGLERAALLTLFEDGQYLEAEIEDAPMQEEQLSDTVKEAMSRIVKEKLEEFGNANPKAVKDFIGSLLVITDLEPLLTQTANEFPWDFAVKQELLECDYVSHLYDRIVYYLMREIEILMIKRDYQGKVKEHIDKNQRDYILREELKVIREELGDDAGAEDADGYLEQLEKLNADKETKEKIKKEIQRFKGMPGGSQEANVLRTYIETVLEMPWKKTSRDNQDIIHAKEVLEEDHYGLEQVKDRVLEFLAVRALTKKGTSPILCLVGPPGTGKTSIARSVARALGKKYVRISLGGIHDEAEIRGHRKTYVGAMPGRIADAMRQAGVANPLMLLDEIDKVSADYRGDVSSALLEVLDGEQNGKFRDHYLEIPLDLSGVLFIATANDVSTIPRPLLDRMEVIEVSSYTENEKFHIAKKYLVPKQLERNGLTGEMLSFSDKALEKIIHNYTREAGVRNLERRIGEICRKAAREFLEKKRKSVHITEGNLQKYLGKEKITFENANEEDEVGIVRGLAWTSVGGDTLQIEVNVMPGDGKLQMTGQMGDVMKESAQIALTYVRSVADRYGVESKYFKEHDLHLHIPEGAVPKDGPSAGITMATAMLSAVTGKKVLASVAMTGEITLRGCVLPIGGLKEKTLAARMAHMKKVLVPDKNRPDMAEISKEITKGMEIVFVKTMDDVVREAFA
ncbi:endopeptidase La [Clostridium sp. OF03-18AA]|uniref:endopeptidase La n=1 Tax=Pilosibacter sp. HC1M1C21 TaxID=3378803 RepID=UPI000E51B0A0|nr:MULTISPECIES: endopeptidase La [unclassified Clostridium]RHP68531.1 endopeptidase La [Clostridium sp. OF03-18AA]HCW26455.1 endopeptidase La [Lachnoclostridium sp.]